MTTSKIPQKTLPAPSFPVSREGMASWLLDQGLRGAPREQLLQEYCENLLALGIPLLRLHVAQSAFHPKFGGIGFDWLRETGISHEHYDIPDEPPESWLESPFYYLLSNKIEEMHVRLDGPETETQFPVLTEFRKMGGTDYFATGVAMSNRSMGEELDPNDTPEGILISWTTDHPDGFLDEHLDTIRYLLPHLALALKSASNRRMATDLLEVYLGRDAGKRVLSGALTRGSLQEISAVILYFDLTGFTSLAEQTAGDELIAMLNDYYGVVVHQVQRNGGNVLKFMGDGLLGMFGQDRPGEAADAALETATALRFLLEKKNVERETRGAPVTDFTLALHAGEILYGNIGAENRLDFTAIGPAVNLTARLSGMHRAVGQDLILSQAVRDAAKKERHDLVSLGRYMLRGVSEPQELFTIHTAPA